MDYLNSLISKWMPGEDMRVKVDSHPRLSGIMDVSLKTENIIFDYKYTKLTWYRP